jgi:hypothetical protein
MSILKKTTILFFTLFLFIQCSSDSNFLVEKGAVGNINEDTRVLDLKSLFKKDSLVSNISSKDTIQKLFSATNDQYEVYSLGGKKMLEITPVEESDSLSKIRSIQIFDPNFKTEKGISLRSTFNDINKNYTINKVETTLTSATLFIDELNATIAIDKKELGLNSFNRDQISIDQIPDLAKVKYFTIWFN